MAVRGVIPSGRTTMTAMVGIHGDGDGIDR
jgi:hypothetical protein